MAETTKTKKIDELRKLIEANPSVSKFLDIMLDGEHTFFLKSYGVTTEPTRSLVSEAITDAGVLPTLTEDEKELVAGIIIKVLQESILKMPRHGTVSRAKKFFDTLYRDMNDDENFSAIVASYMQDVMMDGLVKNDVDGNLMAATITWIVCRSVLIPIVPMYVDAKELHEEKENVEETKENPEQEEKKMIEEKEEPVIEPTSTKEEVSKKDGEKILDAFSQVIESVSKGTVHLNDLFSEEQISRIREMDIEKQAPSTVESKDEGGTMQTSASTSYKEDKKEKADEKPEEKKEEPPKKETPRGEGAPKEVQSKLETLKKLGRGNMDDYRSVANFVLEAIDKIRERYPDMNLEDKRVFMKLLIASVDAFQLSQYLRFVMAEKINDHRFNYTLESWVANSIAASQFKEYGFDSSMETYPYLARDVIAYFLTDVCGKDERPTESMYRQVDRTRVTRLVNFKYLELHITDSDMVNLLVSNADDVSLLDAIIAILHKYEDDAGLINTISSDGVGEPINTIVRKYILG